MSRADGLAPTPATRALLAVARRRLGVDPGADPAALEAVDPRALGALARRHGLQGLVRGGRPAAVDGGAAAGVGADGADVDGALEAVAGNLERIRELHRVLGVLEGAGVPAVALKGPALAVQAWGDVSARSYGDVDVLVPPERAADAVAALQAAGYGDRRARYGLTPSPEHWHDWSFTAPDGRTLVEVHWALVSPARHPAVDTAEVWAEGALERVPLPGGTVPALRPELQIPYLALHATAHHWGWLEFPLTLAALVGRRGDDLDWTALLDRARRWRARRVTAVGLILAGELAGGRLPGLPPDVDRALRADAGAVRLARWYRDRLLLEDPGSAWYRGSPALWWRALQMRDTLPARARAGWQLLFGPTTAEWEAPGEAGGSGPAALRRLGRLWRRWRSDS